MSKAEEHAHVANYTIKAYDDTVDKHPAWGAVMLFYAALHEIERLLASHSKHTCNHSDRELAIKREHKSIWPSYARLRSECDKARYMKAGPFILRAKNVRAELEQGKFREIKTYVDGQLADQTARPAAALPRSTNA